MWPCIMPILITKPTRCTNFSNLRVLLEWNSTCFGQFLCSSSGVFHCTHSKVICHTVLLTAGKQGQDGTSWSCLQAVYKPAWHIPLLCVQWKTPDDEQRNCPKHVEFHSKNKFEKSVRLVGFIIRLPVKSVCVVAVYTICMLMLLSCWPSMYGVCVCVELCDVFHFLFYFIWFDCTGYLFSLSLPLLSSMLFISTPWCPLLQKNLIRTTGSQTCPVPVFLVSVQFCLYESL
jgi:hypothetical protein